MRKIPFPALICLVIVASISGCSPTNAPAEFPQHLMVNFTAMNGGTLFPCGCRIPLGGLSRRAGFINEESPYPHLTLDAGSFCGGNTGYDRFAASYILQAYIIMGYHAVNIGTRESVQKIDTLREWDSISGGMLVSANLIDGDGLPATRTHLIRDIGGIKIGITGMTTQGYVPPDATEMPELILPVPPLQLAVSEMLEEDVDYIVLLADATTPEIEAIVAEIPDFNLVIQGREFNASQGLVLLNLTDSTDMVRIGGSGKYLGRMRMDFEPDGTMVDQELISVSLDSTSPTMSEVSRLMVQFKLDLRDRRAEFLGDPANPFQRSQAPELIDVLVGYTGDAFCSKCHIGYGMDQQVVGHTYTWTRLESEFQADPTCLPCHTTGYGVPTGFEDPYRDSHLRGVTCEACHGPAAEHVMEYTALDEDLDPEFMLEPENPTGIPFSREVPVEVCLRCHTEEWSPDFDYDTWVLRVNHEAARERRRTAMSGETADPSPIMPREHIPPDEN